MYIRLQYVADTSTSQGDQSDDSLIQEYGEKISKLFYHDMLTNIPDLNSLFNQANQLNGHQATALASALYSMPMLPISTTLRN